MAKGKVSRADLLKGVARGLYGVEDAERRAPPPRVDGGEPSTHGVCEDDRHAVGGGDGEEDVRLAAREGVPLSEEGVPALSRGFFEGEDAGAVHLLEPRDFRIRRAEALGQRAGREIGVEGARRQRAAREPGGETRGAGQQQP